jgi:hypothetical protein
VTKPLRPYRLTWLGRLARLTCIALGLRGFVFACNDLRQDELDCEEAVAHLQHCCPGLALNQVSCRYERGCMSEDTNPEISIAESRCVRALDCAALNSTGVCERAAEMAQSYNTSVHDLCL